MKPFNVLGRLAACLFGVLGVCMTFPECALAKVKIVNTSVTVLHTGGSGDISPTEIVCELTCDGYVYITADTNGKTLVYNNDKDFSTDPADLIDLSSDYIKSMNSATSGKVDPDRFGWGSYKLTVEGASTSASPIHVKMDRGQIGELVLGGGKISTIDLTITGGSLNRFVFTGVVNSGCTVSISNCAIRDFNSLIDDSKYSLTMNSWRYLTINHGSGVTYTYPHEMIECIKALQTKGATVNMSFKPNSDKVYEIHDATDFYWFEDYVNNGSSNMNGKLMNDIEIVSNTMIGTNEHPYSYEFDGNGHKISGLNLGSNLSPMAWNTYKNIVYAGLFGYVKGTSSRSAKIKNLTVEGRIYCTSLTTTDLFVAGGVVGIAEQYVEISDVVSNVSISNYKNVKAHIGGIAGTTESTANGPLYIDRCVYKGTIVQDGYNCCGGIVGYIYKGHIHDCLNAGTITNEGNVDGSWVSGILGYVNDWNKSNCFTMKRCLNVGTVSGNNSYAIGFANNCQSSVFESLYYKEGSATSVTDGSAVFGNSLHSVTDEQLKSGEVTYALNGGLTSNPTWRQTIGTDDYPTLDASHKVVYHTYKNCESTVQYSNEDNGRTSEGHSYADGFCTYCKAVDPDYMTAKNGYYEIGKVEQLKWFAAYVNAGNTSANAKLMADITLSDTWTPINSFAGTFDGQGHTVKSVSVTASVCSGFFCINSGTISNLIIGSGTISGVGYVGGICGMNTGTISNCANYASIVKAYYAMSTFRTNPAGGICGLNNGSNAKVENCFNAGSITVTNMGLGSVSGAVVSSLGSAESGAQFVNCYYLGGTASAGILGSTSTSTVFVSSKDDFSNGSVTYRLNNETTTNPVWRQNIGPDSYPVLDKSHQVVYYTYADCDVKTRSYSNTNNGHTSQGHKYVGGICSYCKAVQSTYMTANNGYYEISNDKQLIWFAAYVNVGNGSVKAKLTKDVSQAGNVMIGTHNHPFKGEFDGNGFQISGLNQVSDFGKYNETTEYAGLFGFVQGESDANAVIKNLTVKGTIKLASSTESSTTYFVAGGVVGIADQYVEIEDVVSYVNITNERNVKTHIGGIAATTQYSSANGPLYLDKCVYRGTITQKGNNACGGIVGYINKGHIHDCVNAGTIKNVGGDNNSWVCGILGYVNNSSADNFSVKRCLNVGKVSGNNSYAIGYAKACPSSDFELLYYMSDTIAATHGDGTEDFGESIHMVSADQLKSGEVAYALNGGKTTTPTWYQTIGTDDYPVFDSSHKVVYNTYADCECTVQYSNVNNGRTHQGHLWDEGTITTQPTCILSGVRTFTCAFECGTPKTEVVAANGHTELVLAAVEPTCTESGLTEGKKCSVCDTTLVAQEVVAAKGHKEETLAAVEPTCTENGFSAGKKCSVCKVTLEEQTIIPPTGHTLGSVESAAIDHWFICKTCEAEYGWEDHNHNAEDHSCSVCGVDKAETDEEGYYLVGNCKQLYWLNDYIESYSCYTDVRLVNDIVVNDNLLNSAGELNESDTDLLVWNPISEYQGTFDGQGHFISGLYCKKEYNNVGLFDIAYSSAVIRNLVIRDSYFEGITVGAICRETWYATIENCASHNTIKGQNIGGLVGVGTPQIKNSISTCKLVASSVVEGAETHVGLLVGVIKPEDGMSSSYNSYMDAKIENCFYATSSSLNPFGQSVLYTGDGSENSVLDTLRVVKKPLSAFKSGEVAYLLNQSYNKETKEWTNNEETPAWRQNLLGRHADAFPVLNPSHKRVVKVAEGKAYSYIVKDGKQFGTFCYDVDVALPESMSAFHTVYVDNNRIFGMIVEDGFVPAGTPVILRKPSTQNNVTISFSAAYANATRQLGDTCVSGQLVGLLKVEDGQKLPMGDESNFTYTMQTIGGVQNFYVINSGNFKATQYRCYLDTRVGQNSFQMQAAMNRGECLFDCEETGLQELSSEDQASTPVYNLQGQRVQRMDRGGIYVQNNKRSMIK